MGLSRILVFSALSGISFGFAITAGGDSSGVGINFLVYDYFSNFIDSSFQTILAIISAIFAIFFIFRLTKFFSEVYEHKLAGIPAAILGFVGSVLVILAPQENSHVLVLGIGVWIIGLSVVIFTRKKTTNLN